MRRALALGNLNGEGEFTQACAGWLKQRLGVAEVLLTSSCSAALDIALSALDLKPGDEVILPSYTYVSTANAVIRQGAIPVWVDIRPDTLNLDERLVERAITARTRALLPVHYGGSPAAMEVLMKIASEHGLKVVEDAAAALGSTENGLPAGSMGHMGCFSFHETKNLGCGQGGALCLRDESYANAARIHRDRGTNRQDFREGKVDRYTWVASGAAYSLSELAAAWLWGQLEHYESIAARRATQHQRYRMGLTPLVEQGHLRLPGTGSNATCNHHTFAVILPEGGRRQSLASWLHQHGILAVTHYEPLHSSPMGRQLRGHLPHLPVTDEISRCLLRLPLYHELDEASQWRIVEAIYAFYGQMAPVELIESEISNSSHRLAELPLQ